MPLRPDSQRPIYPLETAWNHIVSDGPLTAFAADVSRASWPVAGPQPDTLVGFIYWLDYAAQPPRIVPIVQFSGAVSTHTVSAVQPDDPAAPLFPGLLRDYLSGPVGARPPNAVYSDLYAALHAALTAYHTRQPADDSARRYLDLLHRLEPPCLHPYYHALNPEFFDWMAVHE